MTRILYVDDEPDIREIAEMSLPSTPTSKSAPPTAQVRALLP